MMKIAIVDDIQAERLELLEFLRRYARENNIVLQTEQFESGEEFLEHFIPGDFDTVFMDIYMKRLNGMETALRLREKDAACLLIFSTATSAYAVKSFRVRAFDYLVKPYTYEQLAEVMHLCNQALGRQSHYIQVKESRRWVKILIKNILYTDYYNHYIQIHTNERVIRTYMSFPEFSPLLLTYPQFLCCYRNCIINMDYVDIMNETDFSLQNGDRLPIHKARRNEIRQIYANYVFNQSDED